MSESNPQWLSMIGHGTYGGEPTHHGVALEAGVHLRWHLADRLGFPPDGFDVFRRESLPGDVGCIDFDSIDIVSDRVTLFGVTVIWSGRGDIGKCGDGTQGLFLPGRQELTLVFDEPRRRVEVTFFKTPEPVTGQAWERVPTGQTLVEEASAGPHPTEAAHLLLALYADRIDAVTITGTDMLVCGICTLDSDQQEDTGWAKLNTDRIHLPITRQPEWPGTHPHSPDDLAEAVARLPTGLSATDQARYELGFTDELHGLLHDLVGAPAEQETVVLHEAGATDHPGATPDLRTPVLDLVKLISIDGVQARVLGLHHLDTTAVDGTLYDYKVVGYWGDQRWPGRHITFEGLGASDATTTLLDHGGIHIASARPLVPVVADWDGAPRPGVNSIPLALPAPIGIFPSEPSAPPVPAVTLRLCCEGGIQLSAYRRGDLVIGPYHLPAGEHEVTADHPPGITGIEIEGAEVTLFEIIVRDRAGTIGDLHNISHRHGLGTGPPLRTTDVTLAEPIALPTGAAEAARPGPGPNPGPEENAVAGVAVGLSWDRHLAGDSGLRSDAPVRLLVDRDYRDNHETPAPPQAPVTLNHEHPKLITVDRQALSPADRPSGMTGAPYDHIDHTGADGHHALAAGWYGYAVRGIDLLGRVGEAGQDQVVEIRPMAPPPPPQAVDARLVDPDDPHLNDDDRVWSDANGPGLVVSWLWPGRARVQHPWAADHDPAFRIYHHAGPANVVAGEVTELLGQSATESRLRTTLTWPGSPNELAGRALRIGDDWFPLTGHGAGTDIVVSVTHLTSPSALPGVGESCSIGVPADAPSWVDVKATAAYDRRLAVVPASGDEATVLAGPVQAVANLADDCLEVTLGVDASLLDDADVPGVLLCDGLMWPARTHTTSGTLTVEVAAKPQPDAPPLEPGGAGSTATYLPGRRYEQRIELDDVAPPPGHATHPSLIGVTASDGDDTVGDDPRWDEPDRGDLGGLPGRESAVGGPATVTHVDRRVPSAPTVTGPGTRTWAEPADYFGRSRVEVTWSPSPDGETTRVHRASLDSVLLRDREARRLGLPPYDTNPFPDDPGALAWLAQAHPTVDPFAKLDPDEPGYVGDATARLVQAAWRDWADRHYPTLGDDALAALADLDVAAPAYQAVTTEPVTGASHLDEIDGRARGAFLWRFTAVTAAGQAGPLSASYGPIWVTPITPPAAPRLERVVGAEGAIHLRWTSAPTAPLRAFRVYRDDPEALADVRRLAPLATVEPDVTPTTSPGPWWFDDDGVLAGVDHHYCVTAVDVDGLESAPCPPVRGRAVAPPPPAAPPITSITWEVVTTGGGGGGGGSPTVTAIVARLTWDPIAVPPGTEVVVQRATIGSTRWQQIGAWTTSTTIDDDTADPYRDHRYRLVARNELAVAGTPGAEVLLATERTL